MLTWVVLRLTTLLPQPPSYWGCRHAPHRWLVTLTVMWLVRQHLLAGICELMLLLQVLRGPHRASITAAHVLCNLLAAWRSEGEIEPGQPTAAISLCTAGGPKFPEGQRRKSEKGRLWTIAVMMGL